MSEKQPIFTRKRLLQGLLIAAALLVGFGLWQVYDTVSEIGLQAFVENAAGGGAGKGVVLLKEQPVYKVKKKQDLLGVSVMRIVSRQQPEEFLVLNGVSSRMVDSIYGKDVDLAWANTMANQLIKMREFGDSGSPVSVEVQEVKTLYAGEIEREGRKLPYWQIEVRFKLSNESAPRFYQAAVIRHARPEDEKRKTDTLVVGYAQKEAFQKELLADLLSNLEFQPN